MYVCNKLTISMLSSLNINTSLLFGACTIMYNTSTFHFPRYTYVLYIHMYIYIIIIYRETEFVAVERYIGAIRLKAQTMLAKYIKKYILLFPTNLCVYT